jgi:murein DD-endopeptidase MepM/ murein hydrolase activator NlpD
MWMYKIILLVMVFEITGCSDLKNLKGESVIANIDMENVDAKSVIDPTPILTPVYGASTDAPLETAYSQNAFVLGTVTPIPTPILDQPVPICSPLASVALESLASIVSDPYNPPPMGQEARHQGVDFAYYRRFDRASIAGDVVQSVFGGKIAGVVQNKFPYGNALIIETPYEQLSEDVQEIIGIEPSQSEYTLYAHLEYLKVQEIGELINPCQSIGVVGKTGNAGVEHLHLEMRIGASNQVFPSMANYVRVATPKEREIYRLWRTSGNFIHFDPMKLLDIKP